MSLQDNTQKVERALTLFKSGEYQEASKLTLEILDHNSLETELLLSCSGILINAVSALGEVNIIDAGISCLEQLIQKQDSSESEILGILEYNLSNGYSAKAELLDREKECEQYEQLIQEQKKCLQNALLKSKLMDSETSCNVRSNYGNLLRNLGRFVEAVDYLYDCIELVPKHAVAMCNCSSALQKILNLSHKHNYRICYEFWRLMYEASQLPTDIIRLTGQQQMLERCLDSVKAIEEYFKKIYPSGLDGLKDDFLGFESAHSSWTPTPELKQLGKDRLLLTVNPTLSNCVDHYRDDICFESIVSGLNAEEEKRFQRLVNVFNHIKEDFATARYLYYKSCSESKELSKISSITYYIETPNFSDFGLKTGFLKTSFRLAADLLDKCAGFINLYLELGHKEDQVILNNVWYSGLKHKKGLHPIIKSLMNQNSYLFALKDLNKDLYLGVYPAPIRKLRNEATHKRLILSLYGSYDKYDKTNDYDEFKTATYLLLRMAKAATIYLVGLVNIQENQNYKFS